MPAHINRTRSNGEGSIYYRKSTKRYYAEITLGSRDGKRVAWRFSSPVRREVVAAMQAKQAEIAAERPENRSTQPLASYLAYWLGTVKATRSPRTWQGYRSIVDVHVAPALGQVPLCDLRPQHLQSLLTELAATLSPATVLHAHRCLHRALAVAVRLEMLDRNPCDRVDPPRVPRREQTTLTADQARVLLDAARDDPLRCYWTLALTTAMRTAELAGLKWADVDLDAGRIRVQRTGQLFEGKWTERDTKTHQGRAITLTALGIVALREHRARQAEARLAAGPRWRDRDLVFANAIGGPMTHRTRRVSWDRLLTRTGLPAVRMYDLRHTCASLLASWGVPVATISEILGHASNRQTWETYITAMPTGQADAMRRLDEQLGG